NNACSPKIQASSRLHMNWTGSGYKPGRESGRLSTTQPGARVVSIRFRLLSLHAIHPEERAERRVDGSDSVWRPLNTINHRMEINSGIIGRQWVRYGPVTSYR